VIEFLNSFIRLSKSTRTPMSDTLKRRDRASSVPFRSDIGNSQMRVVFGGLIICMKTCMKEPSAVYRNTPSGRRCPKTARWTTCDELRRT